MKATHSCKKNSEHSCFLPDADSPVCNMGIG